MCLVLAAYVQDLSNKPYLIWRITNSSVKFWIIIIYVLILNIHFSNCKSMYINKEIHNQDINWF